MKLTTYLILFSCLIYFYLSSNTTRVVDHRPIINVSLDNTYEKIPKTVVKSLVKPNAKNIPG